MRPCPWCGEPPSLHRHEDYGYHNDMWISCTNAGCGVKPSTPKRSCQTWTSGTGTVVHISKTREELIKLWNTRTP